MKPGDNIGNYTITKELAIDKKGQPKGGFGRIYRARHQYLDELACLKINQVVADKNQNSERIEMLWAEAKLLWKLDSSPFIPCAKDFLKVDETRAALVMQYISGDTLENLIEEKGRLHPEDACFVTERLLSALYYCHDKGIVHSDIKPGNIFVDPQERLIKLIDFGLAAYKPKKETVALGYTPRYAAPEIALGKPPLPETDLYGAGIVMLYVLGGEVESKSFPKDTPASLRQFCNRLLRYDPTERPNWKKENIMKTLSDIRLREFGRRNSR